jgi:GNAT superfamily N-acetyltransferase
MARKATKVIYRYIRGKLRPLRVESIRGIGKDFDVSVGGRVTKRKIFKVIGHSEVRHIGKKRFTVENIHVRKGYRRAGLGSALMKETIKGVEKRGGKSLVSALIHPAAAKIRSKFHTKFIEITTKQSRFGEFQESTKLVSLKQAIKRLQRKRVGRKHYSIVGVTRIGKK